MVTTNEKYALLPNLLLKPHKKKEKKLEAGIS